MLNAAQNIPSIGVDKAGNKADRANDKNILRLENLDTDIRPPQKAIEATIQSIESDEANSYLPFLGQLSLRETLSQHIHKLSGHSYSPEDEIIITAGGCNGCLVSLMGVIEPGDEVIVSDPTYIGMLNRIRVAGGVPVYVPFQYSPNEGWRLDTDILKKSVTDKTRAMFFMSPSMPSGGTLTYEEWQIISDICCEKNIYLLYNAAMERILYDDTPYIHPASFDGMRDRVITIGSVSKEYRMIGWRVGWVAGPQKIIKDISQISISDVVVPVGIAQKAAEAAIQSDQEDLKKVFKLWEERRNLILSELDGLPIFKPSGGWSMLLDVQKLGFRAEEAAEKLFDIGKIAATPMIAWGETHGSQYLRFVFSNEPKEKLKGIGDKIRQSLHL